jgi:predicted nucleic acid-binding protein
MDTSVFIETERRNLQALERLNQAMAEGGVALSVVTVAELLASPTLPESTRRFYEQFIAGPVRILPASAVGVRAGVDAAREAGGGMPGDILIAGTAIEHGLKLVTCDADLARILGPSAELLRVS